MWLANGSYQHIFSIIPLRCVCARGFSPLPLFYSSLLSVSTVALQKELTEFCHLNVKHTASLFCVSLNLW